MNPVFTLQYGEYIVAEYLKKKVNACSVFVPTSINEKGIDLLLYKHGKNETVKTVQVKSARPYHGTERKTDDRGKQIETIAHYRFRTYSTKDMADWHVFVCYLEKQESSGKYLATKEPWDSIMLLFDKKELKELFETIRNGSANEKYFELSFTRDRKPYITRGLNNNRLYTENLIEKRIKKIRDEFKG